MIGFIKRLMALAVGIVVLSTPAAAGIIWNEHGAGELPGFAEITYGNAPLVLDGIHGTMQSLAPVNGTPRYEVDLFRIYVSDATVFSAQTISSAPLDTALYLFNDLGAGVYMNDDTPVDLLSLLPAGHIDGPALAGFYYLAIALGGYLPVDAFGAPLFLAGGFTDVLAGDASAGPLGAWNPAYPAFAESAFAYDIQLTGARVAVIPEPAPWLLLLSVAAAWAMIRRPRRI